MTTKTTTQAASVQSGRTINQKITLLGNLVMFVNQRPGLEFGNYATYSDYRSELREIAKTRHQAHELIAFVSLSESIKADRILANARNRLTWDDKGQEWNYCTGQYFPVEYRRAACSLLSSVIWDWLREECGCDTREKIQKAARRNFSPAVAKRWFV